MPLDEVLRKHLYTNFQNALETTSKMLLENIEDKLLDSSRQGYNYTILYDEADEKDRRVWFENPIEMYVNGSLREYLDNVIHKPSYSYWVLLKDNQLRLYWSSVF